jgi:hypothetical protein
MAGIQDEEARVTMARAQRRFGAWREGGRQGQRIPSDLWQAAVELVGSYSLQQVAAALAVNEQRLAKRVAAQQGRIGKERERASIRRDGFVEIGIPEEPATVCTIEMRSAGGGNVVVRVPVSASALVTQIVERLWGRGE